MRPQLNLSIGYFFPFHSHLLLKQAFFYNFCSFRDISLSYFGSLVCDAMLCFCRRIQIIWGNMPMASRFRAEVQPSWYHNQDYQNVVTCVESNY
jgi:hypothetical protein